MGIGIMYIAAKNKALDAFRGLTQADICILDILRRDNKPFNYQVLYHVLCNNCNMSNPVSYSAALSKMVQCEYISRVEHGRNVSYTITLEGKRLLLEFERTLEAIVKDRVLQYGNGLGE